MTSSSLTEPPGCIIALAPAPAACSIPSSFGKKASLARTEPLALDPAFLAAIITESTLDIWPAPTPTVLVPWQRTIALDLTCFATTHPNRSDFNSSAEGLSFVTNFRSDSVIRTRSLSCTKMPPTTFFMSRSLDPEAWAKPFTSRSRRFFLVLNASSADSS